MALHHNPLLTLVVVACSLISLSIRMSSGDAISTSTSSSEFHTPFQGCKLDIEQKKALCVNKGLRSVPQNLPRDIERLDLGRNDIKFLSNSSFARYPRISHLEVSGNDIRVIEYSTFYHLKNLTYLSISLNSNLELPSAGLFKRVEKMTKLDLSFSNMKLIPNDTFEWASHVDNADLSYNHISFINIHSCGNVTRVDLSGNKIEKLTSTDFIFNCQTDSLNLRENPITSVDADVIASLHVRSLWLGYYPLSLEALRNLFTGTSRSKIQEIHLIDISLNHFPTDLFDSLHDYHLSVLEFTSNQVDALSPSVFSKLTQVNQFIFAYNKRPITTFQPDFFEGMQALKVLNMNYNQIRRVKPNNCTWTVNLTELYLSGNRLINIHSSDFVGLENLTYLDLSYNKDLSFLELTAFSVFDKIETIDLSGTSITFLQLEAPTLKTLFMQKMDSPLLPLIPGQSFKHLRYLEYLDLRQSWLVIDNVWNGTLNVSLFNGLLNLKTLVLNNNPYLSDRDELPPGIFQQLSGLRELHLDYCGISNLHHLVFNGLKSLQTLRLRGNKIKQLQSPLLKGLGEIASIELSENDLAYLDEEIFSSNRKLTVLLLADNSFTHFNQSTFQPIYDSLLSIDISMNPIDCNCDLTWFLHWLRKPIELLYQDETFCSSASLVPLWKRPLLDFDPDELCTFNFALFCLIPVAVIGLTIILILVHRNRWQLKYKFFLLKLAVFGYKEVRDARDNAEFEFDVNIIFHEDDEWWIREHLRQAFAEHLPQFQRNIFGDEDLVLGMHYLDSVDYVVSSSYKTIVVLSRAAVRDRWFMLKFRIAMDHVSDTQTEFVVVVFLEDFPDDELPFLARLYLSDGRPYLHWTEDVRGQVYFWNEIVKRLTVNLRTNDWIPNE